MDMVLEWRAKVREKHGGLEVGKMREQSYSCVDKGLPRRFVEKQKQKVKTRKGTIRTLSSEIWRIIVQQGTTKEILQGPKYAQQKKQETLFTKSHHKINEQT